MPIRLHPLATLVVIVFVAAGCHRPQGAIIPYTGGSQTYASTERMPKNVELIDTRTGDVVFAMEIPAGKQLSLDFREGEGDDPVYTPDLMRYQVFENGTEIGRLRNAMSVPSAASRRLDVNLRTGPEYVTAAPDRPLRTDELEDRPDWWTPRGGPMPADPTGLTTYDD